MPTCTPRNTFKEAWKIETATRDVIYNENISKLRPDNKPIRRALGFREIGNANANKPKFKSVDVQHLYSRIDDLAVYRLPVDDLEKLRHGWKEAKLLKTEIEDLLKEYGPKIWGVAMNMRHRSTNVDSFLLVEGEDKLYSTDLFYELGPHRAYIALQLEHLAYVKAIAYHSNHYSRYNSSKSVRHPFQESPQSTRKGSPKTARSLVFKLKLPSNTLFPLRSENHSPFKRKQTAHHVNADRANKPSYKRQKMSNDSEQDVQRFEGRSTRQKPRFLYSRIMSLAIVAGSEDAKVEDNSTGDFRPRHIFTPTLDAQSQHTNAQACNSPHLSASTDTVDFEENAGPYEMTLGTSPGLFQQCVSYQAGFDAQNQHPEGFLSVDDTQDYSGSKALVKDEQRQSMSEYDLVRCRNRLHLLLLGELCDITYAHAKSEDTTKMWEKSQELDEHLMLLWKMDRNEIEMDMGKENFDVVDTVVQKWLLFRKAARDLGKTIELHPSEGKVFPKISWEAWVETLGEKETDEMDFQLTNCHLQFSELETRADTRGIDIAEKLAIAFGYITKQPGAATRFKKKVAAFNEKLFSWNLDFSS